jgi:hypothetical protein
VGIFIDAYVRDMDCIAPRQNKKEVHALQ